MSFTEEASVTSGYHTCSVTRSLTFSHTRSLAHDCVPFTRGDGNSKQIRQKIETDTASESRPHNVKVSKGDMIKAHCNSAPKVMNRYVGSNQNPSLSKHEVNSVKEDKKGNNNVLEHQCSTKSTKPPLRRRLRYKNFTRNPEFVLFRNKESVLLATESASAASDSKMVKVSGSEIADAQVTPALDSNRSPQDLAHDYLTPRPTQTAPGDLTNHLTARISQLQRLRGYGGVEIANLGLQHYCLELKERHRHQQSYDWPNFLRHDNSCQNHPCYDNFENKRHRRTTGRKVTPPGAMYRSGQNPPPRGKARIKNRHTGTKQRGTASSTGNTSYRTSSTAVCYPNKFDNTSRGYRNTIEKDLHDYPTKFDKDSPNSRRPTDANKSSPRVPHTARSKSCPGGTPHLVHHPSCPGLQQPRAHTQGRPRRHNQGFSSSTLEGSTLSEALKARLAFNNMRLVHNSRQGAFSKFYFSRVTPPVSNTREPSEAPDVPGGEDLQADTGESSESSEAPAVLEFVQPSPMSAADRDPSGCRREDRQVRRHSVLSSLMTPHELTLTSPDHREAKITDGNDVMLMGAACRIEPARVRPVPPPIDYPELILKPR
ncbi:hypothetical protein EGW08_005017 [Elysia chlorotica]|uniref:Uncharacterized protein n=1 Tax=Elysia chlorotica TaxID=188477 RepID=A0A3S1HVZ0_ELYCH|nr:hypothetical protein EGW08_005017 [Elysia chlorotica]